MACDTVHKGFLNVFNMENSTLSKIPIILSILIESI